MRDHGRFALALGLAAVLAAVAVVGTLSRRDQDGLPPVELLRVETVPADSSSPADEHFAYVIEILGGPNRFNEAELADRVTPELAGLFTADTFNGAIDEIIGRGEAIRFVRVLERDPQTIRALGIDEDGAPIEIIVGVADDGLLDTLGWLADPTRPKRLAGWDAALVLLAGWSAIAAAAAAWRYGAALEAWTLLVTSIPALAGILVISNSSLAYTFGRASPSLLVLSAVVLLTGQEAGRSGRWLRVVALVAGVVGAVAPFFRDSSLIGHPRVVGTLTDHESVYRVLLTSSAGLTALAIGGVAVVNIGQLGRLTGQVRQGLWLAISVATVLAVAALGAAIDFGTGDGGLASGPFKAITWSAYALVPAAVVFGLIVSRWGRAELAELVIDLESEGADLQPAISKALEDPSLQVLVSPDGSMLLNETGEEVSPDDLLKGRALTRIRSGPRLVGGLVHTSALQRDPDRLEAVAAAAGMAVELKQLNQRVMTQLAEVDASRARILQASDTARRQIERDLHDGAQQRLVALGLRLQRARRQATSGGRDQLAGLLEGATRDVRDTIEEIRAVSRGRQPALLAERGLATAVDALAERAPVPVRIDIAAEELPASAEQAAYYIVAEGLTNMAKHARATRAEVLITRTRSDACITIRDNGRGGAKITTGSGLEGLNDRVAATGGTFRISTGPSGTSLEATIPCE